ncbi:MAG: tRNA (adenosine(37)-N6)-threonylcarbamoyltransferase complex transferase subunit TsaD, partial [Patescibacteria group bacterium]
MIILAIETSCDETAISVLKANGGCKKLRFEILSNVVASQIKIHSQWGGVVPSLAKREHQANLIPVLEKTLKKSSLLISNFQFPISKQIQNSKFKILNSILKREPELLRKFLRFLEEHQKPKIDLIAVTQGPGLEPALWTGINFAKALAIEWNKPLIAINHMEGHFFSVFLKKSFEFRASDFEFPAVVLLASGGHTQLVLMKDFGDYKIIGETLDDAAGEAFDKVARMLGLGYPGGPAIAAEAAKFPASGGKIPSGKIQFPRPLLHSKDFNFSFSGLKTAVLYKIKEIQKEIGSRIAPAGEIRSLIAYEFQQAVIDVLLKKTIKAAK